MTGAECSGCYIRLESAVGFEPASGMWRTRLDVASGADRGPRSGTSSNRDREGPHDGQSTAGFEPARRLRLRERPARVGAGSGGASVRRRMWRTRLDVASGADRGPRSGTSSNPHHVGRRDEGSTAGFEPARRLRLRERPAQVGAGSGGPASGGGCGGRDKMSRPEQDRGPRSGTSSNPHHMGRCDEGSTAGFEPATSMFLAQVPVRQGSSRFPSRGIQRRPGRARGTGLRG